MPNLSFSVNSLVVRAQGNLSAGTGAVTSSITSPTGQVITFSGGLVTNVSGNGVGTVSPINADYFSNLTTAINSINVCSELQALVDDAFSSLQDQINDINAQLAALNPILALLSSPSADLTAIVTWITNFINDFLTPFVIPITTYATQLTELASQIAALITAINNAAARIEGCSIVIPTITF